MTKVPSRLSSLLSLCPHVLFKLGERLAVRSEEELTEPMEHGMKGLGTLGVQLIRIRKANATFQLFLSIVILNLVED